MRRREFIGLAGAAATLPTRAFGQAWAPETSGLRRLGVLIVPAHDAFYKPRATALVDGLAALGWKAGGNLRIDWRHTRGDPTLFAPMADELVALVPNALLAVGSPCVEALRRRTQTIPIVFTVVTDPIGQGFVENLSRPGANLTGFTDFDVSMGAKWLEMLTRISPPIATVGVLYSSATAPLAGRMMQAIGEAAAMHGVSARALAVANEVDIDAAAATMSGEARAGCLVMPDSFTIVNRAVITRAAARARLPAIYWNRAFVLEGGLMSYGADTNDLHRRAADYVDRILKGANPGELPVQYPMKFELVINLTTARALGVDIPTSLLAAANEVIE